MALNDMVIGTTALMGLIGNPVKHSISPLLHNTLNRELNVDAVYVPFNVEGNQLADAVRGLKALNVSGFNVTIPYKKEVIKHLDEVSQEALFMGAVNTVKNIDGRFYGYNTDAEGFMRSFREENGCSVKDKAVAVIGAGGTARAICIKLALEGAKKIYILNRNLPRAAQLADIIESNIRKCAEPLLHDADNEGRVIPGVDVIINTTPAGMYPETGIMPIKNESNLKEGQIIYDVIYNPSKTLLLKKAEERGCKAVNGIGMLFYQGILAYEIWTGIKLEQDLLRSIKKSFVNFLGSKERNS